MSILSFLIFIPLQILFVPLAIVGILLVAYKQLVLSKRLGISQTAIEILNGRWTMHVFNIRCDRATAKLAKVLPNTSLFGLWLALLPLWLKFKISGSLFLYPRIPEPGDEKISDVVISRTLYFDNIIQRLIGEVEQFVVMGAGYDMRAYGDYSKEGITFFELDQAIVQQHKREMLKVAGINGDHVRYVSVDFSNENILQKLSEAGFDKTKKTLLLWEGVTLYLPVTAVRQTMQEVHANVARGSVLLADIYADRFVNIYQTKAGKKALDYTGEGMVFGLDFSANHRRTLAEFVERESMVMGEAFFLGEKNEKGPYAVVVEMRCD